MTAREHERALDDEPDLQHAVTDHGMRDRER